MKAHDLADMLMLCPNVEVTASIDISTCDEDSGRRIFTNDCMGVNDINCQSPVILFSATHEDNYGIAHDYDKEDQEFTEATAHRLKQLNKVI